MVKCLPDLCIFAVFLKNKNIIFKTRRSKVTDYAALNGACLVRVVFDLVLYIPINN